MSIIIDGQSLRNHIQYLRRQTFLLNKKIENLSPVSGGGSGGIMPAPSSQGANISIANLPVKDEDNMASNSDVHLVTQQSVKQFALPLAGGVMTGSLTVGVDDTGHDVKFFGATSGAYLLWDESADKLLTAGGTTIDIVKDKLLIGGTAVTTTAAELNVLDGIPASLTATEIGYVDGVTSAIQTQLDAKLPLSGGAMTGAITTNSTFDGRDVSVDGTKLDGIEANAQVNVATNLGKTTATGQITITSSTGSDVVIGEATDAIAGLMSTTHHDKLDGIAASANNYTLPTAASGTLGGVKVGTNLTIDGNGVLSAGPIALTTVQTAASQAAQLALTVQEGDVVVRTDQNKSYIRNSGTADDMTDFQELLTPTDAVLSVTTTDGTYINLTPNTATTGAINVTADLSAADGTADTTTRFLSKDNTWDVPAYTTETYTAHDNISAASSVDNSGRTYIQDITLDSNGHVTGLASATETVTNTFRTVKVDTNGDGSANNTLEATEDLMLKKGSNITLAEAGGVVTISSTATGTVDGSGTANDVVMWSDSDTLTDAPIAISGNDATFAGKVLLGQVPGAFTLNENTGVKLAIVGDGGDNNDGLIITRAMGNQNQLDQFINIYNDGTSTFVTSGGTSTHGTFDFRSTTDKGDNSVSRLSINASGNATFAGIVTTDKIFVAKGQNLTHGTSQLKLSQENSAKSQIRFYGADTSTAGSLEFVGSSSDGSAGGIRMTINANGSVDFINDVSVYATRKLLLDGNGGHTYLYENSDDRFQIYVGGAEYLDIDQDALYTTLGSTVTNNKTNLLGGGSASVTIGDGSNNAYVGINDSSPSYGLDVNGTMGVSDNATFAGAVGIGVTPSDTTALTAKGTTNLSSRITLIKDLTTDKVLKLGADRDTTARPFIGSTSAHGFDIISGNAPAITLDTSQNATFAGAIIQSMGNPYTKMIDTSSGGDDYGLNNNQSKFSIYNWTDGREELYFGGDGNATFDGNVSVNGAGQKAVLHVKNEGNNWEDGVLLEHDSGDTGWNIHPENNSDNALWFGYNSDTSVALTSQAATVALKLNSDLSATFLGVINANGGINVTGNIDTPELSINDYIKHNGDTNTYFGFPGADTYKVVTTGQDALTIDSNQGAKFEALVYIEDGTNPDGSGTSSGVNSGGTLTVEGRRDGTANLLCLRARDNTGSTLALPADQGGLIRWQGFDGTDFSNMGAIAVNADGQDVANGDSPSKMIFYTVPDGSDTPTTALTIDRNQNSIFAAPIWIPDYIYHTGDSNTYFGFSGADTYVVAAGGTSTLQVSADVVESSGIFAAGNGAVGAPAFTFASDLNTGIYRTGADSIGFATGGSVALTIGDNDATFAGKVGIGVSPTTLLHLNGTGDAIRVESTNAGSGGAQIDLLHFTASPADEDTHGMINMGGYYTGTTSVYGSQILSKWTDVSERHSRLEFKTCDTTLSTVLTLDHAKGATFTGYVITDGQVGVDTYSPYTGTMLHASGASTSPDTSATNPADTTAFFTNSDIAYGTLFATHGSGIGEIMQRRTNTSTYYDLHLQPHGGEDAGLGIGGSVEAGFKFQVNGNSKFSGANTVADFTSSSTYSDIIFRNSAGVGGFVNFNSTTSFNVYVGGGSGSDHKLSLTNAGLLTVTGDVVAYGSPSDISLKENIKPIDNALDKVSKLKGVTFDWKKSDSILKIKEDIGFIAQDVKEVLPDLVRTNDDGKLSLRDKGIIPVLVEAIKELEARVKELENK